MIRFRVRLATLFAICGIVGTFVYAQDSDEATPRPVTKSEATPKPTPKKKSTAGKKPASKPSPKPTKTPAAKKKKKKSEPTATPSKKKKKKASSTPASSQKRKNASPIPAPKQAATPEQVATPAPEKPAPAPRSPGNSNARLSLPGAAGNVPQVNIEKSGFLGDQGYEPPPTPPPRRGWWFWSRPEVTYRYLTRSVREQIDRAPVQRQRWQFIIVHNSGTRQGNARIFDYYHRHVRRMQNGLAYHFVIGNGTSTGDGEIEVGDRWRRQINGGHVHSDYLNNIALGICLVGDFNRDQPTRRQLESCEELIRYLEKRCGKYQGHDLIVRPHRDVNPPRWATDCPGDRFPYQWFRRF